MMGLRRLYFLLPDVATAHKIVDELLLVHIPFHHIHILANPETPIEDLPAAGFTQTTDLVPALERGLAAGGTAGILAGLLALAFPLGPIAAGGAILLGALGGAGFGCWVSGMIGIGIPNSRLERFTKAVAGGQLLMMVDVPKTRVEEFEELIHGHHPEAEIEGTEPTIPAFP